MHVWIAQACGLHGLSESSASDGMAKMMDGVEEGIEEEEEQQQQQKK